MHRNVPMLNQAQDRTSTIRPSSRQPLNKSGDNIVTGVTQGCLGCGTLTDAPSHLCSCCAEIVEFEKFYQSKTEGSNKSKAQNLDQQRPKLLTKIFVPCPIFMMTLAGVIVIAAVFCQSTELDCRLFAHCLLS